MLAFPIDILIIPCWTVIVKDFSVIWCKKSFSELEASNSADSVYNLIFLIFFAESVKFVKLDALAKVMMV